MSFALWPWLAEASPNANTRSESLPEPGGMQSLQSTDDSVLRLHSCRALSPEPQRKVAQLPTAKRLVFGLFNRFGTRLNTLNQKTSYAVGS